MGSRYMISGVQLGMLKAFTTTHETVEVETLLDKIGIEQHIQDSMEPLEKDIEDIRDLIFITDKDILCPTQP